ncbi:MAG: carboxypeptidase M32 [Simkaniaceae bacterium]
MKNSLETYQHIASLSKEIKLLSSIDMLLEWDKETYMPKDGILLRSMQKEYLATLIHDKKTSEEFKAALQQLIDLKNGTILANDLDEPKQAALKQWRKDFLNHTKLPSKFVSDFAKITTEAAHVWSDAKNNNAFDLFSPHLEKVVSNCRQMAEYLGYKEHPYDALLDLYEPGMTKGHLNSLFEKIKPFLIRLLHSLKDFSPRRDFLSFSYEEDKQLKFARSLLNDMGLTENFCRIDLSSHPFCMGLHPKDLRITTHVQSSNIMANILAHLHEGGHGLYEAGLPESEFGTPLGEAVSLGIHESQSRLWETMIGHGLPFWKYYYPKLQKTFPESLQEVSLQEFYDAINLVAPSFIRVFADEVTYCLHVILRYEIELQLIEGNLLVKDVPKAWNTKMLDMFGMTPSSDTMGCLQDIHWSLGAIGYFPTYALGNIYAGQIFQKIQQDFADWEKRLENGDLKFITQWLFENIYKYGKQFSPTELIQKATGKHLSPEPYMEYLANKYQSLIKQ